MPESINDRYRRWKLDELVEKYPGLRLVPRRDAELTLVGELSFCVQGPVGGPLEDHYSVKLSVSAGFPAEIPVARETGGRIPPDYHKLKGGSLCLGPPTEVRLRLHGEATLLTFVESVVIPYLFGYSYFAKFGVMPFGELGHGVDGLRQHFSALFGVPDGEAAEEFVRLTSLKRRRAIKARCPCGSGMRLGRCHHLRVDRLRGRLGRAWFRQQHDLLTDSR